jgi:hypothetical protein
MPQSEANNKSGSDELIVSTQAMSASSGAPGEAIKRGSAAKLKSSL